MKINKKNRHYVTLLDTNYVPKAVVTYLSLRKLNKNYLLYVFCFDDLSYKLIKELNYPGLIAISTLEFENKELLKCKQDKKKTKMYEYYWACKPYCVKYIMKKMNADIVTYIDCDFMFLQSPEEIFEEMDEADVLIQPNNFSSGEMKEFVPVGYYCSCYESFRNNSNGIKVLNWWHKKNMEWCYARFEPGKFADQKYLDDWRIRFKSVKEIINIGANLSPWNVQKYNISKRDGRICVNNVPVIYYHFHSFKMNLLDYSYQITGDRENFYDIPKDVVKLIYISYAKSLKNVISLLKNKFKEYNDYCTQYPEGLILPAGKNKKIKYSSYKEVKQ